MDHEGIFEEITDNELPSQIANSHFLENQLRAVLPMRILQLLLRGVENSNFFTFRSRIFYFEARMET
jgi:hypothetical protein